MAHGGPDWGTAGPIGTIFTIEDLGELAARLGSIVTFDRRGNVVYMDDFEDGVELWGLSGLPIPGDRVWTADAARSGAFSCKLLTIADEDATVTIHRPVSYPALSKFGLKVSFSYGAYWKYIEFWMQHFIGKRMYKAYIRYDYDNALFEYLDSGGDYQEAIPEINIFADKRLFNTLKLVVDISTNEYSRLLVNNKFVDLTGKALDWEASDVPPNVNSLVVLQTRSDDVAYAYVDDIIITQNEL